MQNDATNNFSKKLELESELASARVEIRDAKQRVNELNMRVQDFQRNVLDLQTDKIRQSDRIQELEKVNLFLSRKMTNRNSANIYPTSK